MAGLRKTHLKHSEAFLSGVLGGAFTFLLTVCLFKAGFLTFERKPSFAIVDTQKLLRECAEKIATSARTPEEMEAAIKPFIEHLNKALSIVSKEKGALLLQPTAVASANIPDLTEDVQKLLLSLENREANP